VIKINQYPSIQKPKMAKEKARLKISQIAKRFKIDLGLCDLEIYVDKEVRIIWENGKRK